MEHSTMMMPGVNIVLRIKNWAMVIIKNQKTRPKGKYLFCLFFFQYQKRFKHLKIFHITHSYKQFLEQKLRPDFQSTKPWPGSMDSNILFTPGWCFRWGSYSDLWTWNFIWRQTTSSKLCWPFYSR
jgi:hypothetical protein